MTPIWEGTTNILSIDVLRASAKTKGEAFVAFQGFVLEAAKEANKHPDLQASAQNVTRDLTALGQFVQENPHLLESAARDLAFSLARIFIGKDQNIYLMAFLWHFFLLQSSFVPCRFSAVETCVFVQWTNRYSDRSKVSLILRKQSSSQSS